MGRAVGRVFVLLVLACLLVPGSLVAGSAAARVHFTDVSEVAGLVVGTELQPPSPPACVVGQPGCEVDRMTGGAAVADVDGDGWVDLFLTTLDGPDRLFRNLGDGRFDEISEAAGLAAFDLHSNGAAFADIDNDGDPDLFVTVVGTGSDGTNDRNYLFVNDGTGRFDEEARVRGAAMASSEPRLSFSVAFGDYDGDGWLDLHTTEWLAGGHSRVLRNLGEEGAGVFEDVTERAGLSFEGVNSFASAFVDLDDDGFQDLVVAADFGSSRLFWNQGDGTFVDGTAEAGVGTDENGTAAAFGDYDGDGDLDWFVTSIFDSAATCARVSCGWGHSGNRLYRNDGGRSFSDATDAAGVRNGMWGFGASFLDFDNDGDLDLAMANGVEMLHAGIEARARRHAMRLWENDGTGAMTEVSDEAGVREAAGGKALVGFDYDQDGDVDILVANNAGAPRLYRNDLNSPATGQGERSAANHPAWLRLEVVGVKSSRDAVGAVVRVWADEDAEPQVRTVGVSGHFLGHGEATLHFGFGRPLRRVHRVEVEFPASGRIVARRAMRSNRTYVLREPPFDELVCGDVGVEAFVLLIPLAIRRRQRSARSNESGARKRR